MPYRMMVYYAYTYMRIIKEHKVGVLVDDYQPKTMAKVIKNLLNDALLLLEIKENQQKAKEVLCWEKESKKLDKYFK